MDVNGYMKLFADSKESMTLNEAANYVHYLRTEECHYIPRVRQMFKGVYINNDETCVRRFAQITACAELEKVLRDASPWEDYREIIARLEWPYVYRVVTHLRENRYDGPNGEKWKKADAWFVMMWEAYHDIFHRMPGLTPDLSVWRNYEFTLDKAKHLTAKYRRKLCDGIV